MAEEIKKPKKPIDPNSAKFKLGKIDGDAFASAIEAKKEGIPVAWVSSNFPVEIPETLGIATSCSGHSLSLAYARLTLAYAQISFE